MQRLEVSGAVRPIYGSLGVKRLNTTDEAALFYPILPNSRNRSALLGALAFWGKAPIIFLTSVGLLARISAAPTGRIYVRFNRDYHEYLSRNTKNLVKTEKKYQAVT